MCKNQKFNLFKFFCLFLLISGKYVLAFECDEIVGQELSAIGFGSVHSLKSGVKKENLNLKKATLKMYYAGTKNQMAAEKEMNETQISRYEQMGNMAGADDAMKKAFQKVANNFKKDRKKYETVTDFDMEAVPEFDSATSFQKNDDSVLILENQGKLVGLIKEVSGKSQVKNLSCPR